MGLKEAWKAQQERSRATFHLGHTVAVRNGEIIHGRKRYPLAGARATVDTAGAIDRRVTATRLILTGPFAFGLRKKKDSRELFLMVEGDGFAFVVELDPKRQKEARAFAAKLNAAAGRVMDEGSTSVELSIPEQIRQLGELRDHGMLTPEEFEAKKSELLRRL